MEEFLKYFFYTTFNHHFQAKNAKVSPIFHFDQGNNGRICHILCVKMKKVFIIYGHIFKVSVIVEPSSSRNLAMMMMSQSNACPSPLHTALWNMRKYFVQKLFCHQIFRQTLPPCRQFFTPICIEIWPIMNDWSPKECFFFYHVK